MNGRTLIVIGLALVCGVSAAIGMTRLRDLTPAAPAATKTKPVVVASENIARGRMVTAEMLKLKDWPADLLPPHALNKIDEAVDRASLIPIVAGEPVLDAKLADRDSGRGLATMVPEGMRAYTVRTASVASRVAGFLLPGNRVDVLLTLRGSSGDQTGGGSTTTLLQSVEILACDQRLDAPAANKMDSGKLASVTLLVSPDQAALLDLGQNMGEITLTLRNPEDLAEADTVPATLKQLRFTQRGPLEEPEAESKEEQPSWFSRQLGTLARAAANIRAQGEEVAAAAPAPEAEVSQDEVYQIRTLRGRQTGRVLVHQYESGPNVASNQPLPEFQVPRMEPAGGASGFGMTPRRRLGRLLSRQDGIILNWLHQR